MDFVRSDELLELQELARTVCGDLADSARLREVETGAERVDRALWQLLFQTGLSSVALGEEAGGAGLGLEALAVVLEEQGRHGLRAALWSHALAARVLDRAPQHRHLVARAVTGDLRLGVAIEEYLNDLDVPRARAVQTATGWELQGVKALGPEAASVQVWVVSALVEQQPSLFLVAAGAPGLKLQEQETTDHDLAGDLVMDAVPAELLGGDRSARWYRDLVDEVRICLAALQVGIADGAMQLAAEHLRTRVQFGRPLGSFQAAQHQMADTWIDVDAMRLVVAQALSDHALAPDDPAEAERSALVAAWWAAQAGMDVVHRTQHVHGGLGVDVDHPVHRHYLMARQVAGTLGGAELILEQLGDQLAHATSAS